LRAPFEHLHRVPALEKGAEVGEPHQSVASGGVGSLAGDHGRVPRAEGSSGGSTRFAASSTRAAAVSAIGRACPAPETMLPGESASQRSRSLAKAEMPAELSISLARSRKRLAQSASTLGPFG